MDSWPELAGIGDDVPAPPGPEIVRGALRRSALEGGRPPAVPKAVRAWALLTAEARVQPVSIWLISALVMTVGVGFVLAKPYTAVFVLAMVAPLVAGAGVAAAYGPRDDRVLELVAVTPTSPRVILLARMTLVFGYDLALALVASAMLSPFQDSVPGPVSTGLVSLVTAWLGPTTVLAALSLLLSVCWNAEGAVGVALGVWGLYLMSFTKWPVLAGIRQLWTTSPATIGLALVLASAAVVAAGRGEPIRRLRATHGS
ncbi:hypothetical protein [Streptosporangium carneum]|uniref:Uncharacterized protein n=1 Tax=Streptosporangium carneum TaxID=47481 RepID=A0A9W6MGB1_9ACTN|nr:hypothetical protein [Streptosporangium carneum]GLK12972.1 hypothetical protein GCM10017600_63820 [Streptosporangium carneum]